MASSKPEPAIISRRAGLLTGGLLAATSCITIPPALAEQQFIEVSNLSSFQKSGQRKLMLTRAVTELKKVLTPEDAPLAVRLVLADAASYDVATGAGGVNGSIILSGELDRPENALLKPLVQKLRAAKDAIDEGAAKVGQAPITWADTLVVAGKVATELSWVDIKIKRSVYESGGRTIAEQFGTEFPLQLGRLDASQPDAPSKLPPAGAPVEEITAFMAQLGNKPSDGPAIFPTKAPFWERPTFVLYTAASPEPALEEARFAETSKQYEGLKRKYDISRNTVTRTDYEVDFIDFYTKLANLGAKFDTSRYLYRIPLDAPTKL